MVKKTEEQIRASIARSDVKNRKKSLKQAQLQEQKEKKKGPVREQRADKLTRNIQKKKAPVLHDELSAQISEHPEAPEYNKKLGRLRG